MNCPGCGAPIGGEKFCKECGLRLNDFLTDFDDLSEKFKVGYELYLKGDFEGVMTALGDENSAAAHVLRALAAEEESEKVGTTGLAFASKELIKFALKELAEARNLEPDNKDVIEKIDIIEEKLLSEENEELRKAVMYGLIGNV
ncbi:MAG: hypothetical protein IJT09_01750 [Abditibacteriota bacterium]|nr:hypothetical protein [Abditibacteriota bacterium]